MADMPTKRDFAHSQGRNIDSVCNKNFDLYPASVSQGDFELRSHLPNIAAAALTEDTAYFVYLGKTNKRLNAKKVLFHVVTGGSGAQTAEVGLFSSPAAPNRAAQTLTKLAATGTLGDLTGTGVLGNSSDFGTSIPAGTHLWAGIRTAMATNEPQVYGLTADMSAGNVLSTATAGALTSGTTFAGALITASVTAWQAPCLTLSVE